VALAGLNVSFAPPAAADPPKAARPAARKVEGKIVRTDSGQFVVKTTAGKEMTVNVRPKTKFMHKDKEVKFTDLRVGANVTVDVIAEDDRDFADSVLIVEEAAAEETLIEGEIVRVVGEDQVGVLTPERKEVIVFVDPQTKFLIDEKAAKFTDLQRGANVRVNVNVRNGRHMAREVVVPRRRR
jgi:hypothetical protein